MTFVLLYFLEQTQASRTSPEVAFFAAIMFARIVSFSSRVHSEVVGTAITRILEKVMWATDHGTVCSVRRLFIS